MIQNSVCWFEVDEVLWPERKSLVIKCYPCSVLNVGC